MENKVYEARGAIFRDIRRYYCEYCGICRSKKSLISAHMLTNHQEELNVNEQSEGENQVDKLNTCRVCGSSFQKPAHLKQHMQGHSLERPFTCPVDDCHSSYRRQDHLTRHMIRHQGKLFECPVKECKHRFAFQCNVKRHVKELHGESAPTNVEPPKEYVCPELGCGKLFRYQSQLRKHEDSHVKLDTVEAFCSEPGCMKYFTNEQCLREHLLSCHQHIVCDKCGSKQLKKNFKRHLSMHEAGGVSLDRINCSFDECLHTFATRSNLNQHIRAVHMGIKPYACTMPGCHMEFAFKHVRDKHEKSGCHVYTPGNFQENDEQFRSRPRGGRKRKFPVIEILMRKRVVPPGESDLTKLFSAKSHD